MKLTPDRRVLLALGVTVLIWASAFAGIRAGLEAYTPGHLALLRFLVGSSLLVVYALYTRMPLPAWRDLPAVVLGGFLGFTVYHAGLAFGQVTVEAGSASLIIYSVPVYTALLAVAFLGERLGVLGWIGTLVSFGGVALISLGEGGTLGGACSSSSRSRTSRSTARSGSRPTPSGPGRSSCSCSHLACPGLSATRLSGPL